RRLDVDDVVLAPMNMHWIDAVGTGWDARPSRHRIRLAVGVDQQVGVEMLGELLGRGALHAVDCLPIGRLRLGAGAANDLSAIALGAASAGNSMDDQRRE